jgi:oligopeptidase B
MRNAFFITLILIVSSCKDDSPANLQAPVAKKTPKEFNEQGNKRTDNYFWLSDPSDSTVINHLKAENAFTESMLKHTEKTQKAIYDELVARIDQKYESLPVKNNGYWYYIRYEEGKQYPLHCRKKDNLGAPEEIMINVNELAAGKQIFLVRTKSVSRDNNWIAYAADTSGDRRSTIYIKNINTGEFAPDKISNTSDLAWMNDNKTLYYTLNDHTVRAYKVMKHTMGSDPITDKQVYVEKDSTFGVELSASKDNRYIFITSSSTTTTEAQWLDANNPASEPIIIQSRIRDVLYYPSYYEGNQFHIITNKDAKNFKLVTVPVATPGITNWKDLLSNRDSSLLEDVEVLQNFIVAQYKTRGLSEIKVTSRKDNSDYKVDFGEETYVAGMNMATDAYNCDSIRYNYQSLTTPSTDFAFNLVNKQKILLKQQKVGGGFDASKYETKRLWAKVTDGTMVPVSIVYKKNTFQKDGGSPLLLYAYGSYGISTDPDFNSSVISLLDRDFVYAIAHVRGGQEMGRYWYEDGKLLKKKNTFTDFIDCAQFLVNEKYTSSDKLFANGGSAGGMLMAGVANMRPDLFRGILAEVPWTDVITDMFNTDLPLTTLEYDEWGDPNKKEYYDYMLSWSPYDNVKKTNYPAIFATGGLNDTQVPYFSPAKWVQKLRGNNTGTNPVLFKCNMGAGHGGESGRFERQKLTALKYAFMLDLLEKK